MESSSERRVKPLLDTIKQSFFITVQLYHTFPGSVTANFQDVC